MPHTLLLWIKYVVPLIYKLRFVNFGVLVIQTKTTFVLGNHKVRVYNRDDIHKTTFHALLADYEILVIASNLMQLQPYL